MSSRPTNPSLAKAASWKQRAVSIVTELTSAFSDDDIAHVFDTELTLRDLQAVVKLIPRIVHLIRERGHDHEKVLADFRRLDGSLTQTFADARAALRAKYQEKVVQGPGPTAPAPAPVRAEYVPPAVSMERAFEIAGMDRDDYLRARARQEAATLERPLNDLERRTIFRRASLEYKAACDMVVGIEDTFTVPDEGPTGETLGDTPEPADVPPAEPEAPAPRVEPATEPLPVSPPPPAGTEA